jgi:hypothetical protein
LNNTVPVQPEFFFLNPLNPATGVTLRRIFGMIDDLNKIHKASSKINYDELISFFKSQHIPDPPSDINYANYIETSVTELIENKSDTPEEKNQKKEGLEKIMKQRLENLNYSHFKNILNSIYYCLEFSKKQSNEFKSIYTDSFIEDCIHGHGRDSMTCAAAALEGFVLSLIPASTTDPEKYEKLISIIESNPVKLIPGYIQEWFVSHYKDGPGAFPKNTSEKIILKDLKTFLLNKFPNSNEETKKIIKNKITETQKAFSLMDEDTFMYKGGKRRTRKRGKKGKKRRKQNRKTKKQYKKNKE